MDGIGATVCMQPPLRANGARECAPDDRLREATQGRSDEDWIASSLALLAMTAVVAGQEFRTQKKPGSKEPGLRYWPRGAGTITFQEGLLSVRATWRRGTYAQRECSACKHYGPRRCPAATTHAACQSCGDRGPMMKDHDGQRCALLTTKSRNTCTRATVFNSSG